MPYNMSYRLEMMKVNFFTDGHLYMVSPLGRGTAQVLLFIIITYLTTNRKFEMPPVSKCRSLIMICVVYNL